jgi:hypothetical protein
MEYREQSHEAVVMSGFGRNANWLRNVESNREARIDISSKHFCAAFRILGEVEAIHVITEYERRHRVLSPIIKGVLSRLLGWKYTGSTADRRNLVHVLPLVAFRPISPLG